MKHTHQRHLVAEKRYSKYSTSNAPDDIFRFTLQFRVFTQNVKRMVKKFRRFISSLSLWLIKVITLQEDTRDHI
jgi:hypothetical protein